MNVCRECGRLPFEGNPLDREGYHERGCSEECSTDRYRVVVPSCLGCRRMPWDCDCEDGPWFLIGPPTEDEALERARRREGP
jgi:hypothetical protein